jgi:hypothetical protein
MSSSSATAANFVDERGTGRCWHDRFLAGRANDLAAMMPNGEEGGGEVLEKEFTDDDSRKSVTTKAANNRSILSRERAGATATKSRSEVEE